MARRTNRKARKPMKSKQQQKKQALLRTLRLIPKAKMPHYFVRCVTQTQEDLDSFNLANTDDQAFKAYQTTMNMVDGVNELNQLFDSYKITAVKYEFLWNQGDNASISSASAPALTYFYDHDDAITPSDGEFRQRSSKKMIKLSPFKNHVIVDKRPTVAETLYVSGLTNGYAQRVSPRIDMANLDVPHYGLKCLIDKPPVNIGFIRVRRTVYVTCYNVR